MLVFAHRRLRLGVDEVTLATSRFRWRRRRVITIPYSDIIAIEKVASELEKGSAVILRGRDGQAISVAYPRRSELRMRSICHQLQKRVRAARQPD